MARYELQPDYISALDIGTSATTAAIAQVNDDGQLELLGVGTAPSTGIRKGMVVNVKETISAIEGAVIEAETQADVKMDAVYVSISGEHIRSINNSGVISIGSADSRRPNHREITPDDVDRVLDQAKAITLPPDRQILHILPQEFKVDLQDGIKDPVGHVGHRLEARVHLVTIIGATAQNIIRCVEAAGLYLNELVLAPLASAYAVLDQTEMDQGVVLIDMGAGTTDIVVYYEGGVRQTSVLPLGGHRVTSDIAQVLHTTFDNAEELKLNHGFAKFPATVGDDEITIDGIAGRQATVTNRRGLAEIIEPRLEEILLLCRNEVRKSEVSDKLTFGVVLTGGGILLREIEEKAGEVFNADIKLGYPIGMKGLADQVASPEFAVVTGLLRYGQLHGGTLAAGRNGHGFGHLFQNFGSQLKGFFKELF